MKGLLRFIVFAGLGLALLWVIVAGEGLFPARPEPGPAAKDAGAPHRPIAEFKQGEGAVTIAPRGRIRIDSSKRIETRDGGLEQRPRYRIEARDSEPDPLGTYTLFDAVVTFFEDAPRPAPVVLIEARRMTVALVTGSAGFQPREDQEMLLTGAAVSTGEAFTGGRFRLRTDQLLVLMGRDGVLLHSPAPETPFRLEGEVGGGTLELKGRGLTARLPPLAGLEGQAGGEPAAASGPELRFQGTSGHEGTWRRGAQEVQFGCLGPLGVVRTAPDAAPLLSMDQDVRLRGQGAEGPSSLRGDALRAAIRPGSDPPGSRPGLEWLRVSGRPALFGDPRGELRAQNLATGFDDRGALRWLLAEGKPFLKGSAGERGEIEARCSGPLRLAGLAEPHLPLPALPGSVAELMLAGMPGYRVALTGSAALALDAPAGPVRIDAAEGIDLLLSRGHELLAVSGRGRTEAASGRFKALSLDGFTRFQAPWQALFPRALTLLGPDGESRPVRFTLLDGPEGEQGSSRVEASGLLELRTGPQGEELLEIQAAGAGGFISVAANAAGEPILLEGARTLGLCSRAGDQTRIRADADWFLPFRLELPARGTTAWGWRLEGGREELRLFGAEGQPALLAGRLEALAGEERPVPGRLRLFAPELSFVSGEARLIARGGVRLHLAGAGLLPGAEQGESTFWARSLELRRSAPAREGEDPGPDTAHLIGRVFALIADGERTTWAGGDELMVFLAEGRALLSGAAHPACLVNLKGTPAALAEIARVQGQDHARRPRAIAEILRTGDERSLAVLSSLIRISREEMVAGQLESGLGARLLLAAAADRMGPAAGFIEADSPQPISIKGRLLTFPGYTTMREGTLGPDGSFIPDQRSSSLVCGAMTCRRADGPGGRFDLIQGEKGVEFQRGVFSGSGGSLRFAPLTGELELDGQGAPCTVALGSQVVRGPRLRFNVFDFTMTTPGFLLVGPAAAEAGLRRAR